MDFSSLKAYCTVVETGSISKAARKLFITQPALSVKIQGLEKFYQETLLDRTNKGITPTETGMLVYNQGQKILTIMENIEKEIQRNKLPVRELTVGAASTIGNYALPCTVYVFSERFPDYKISLEISNSENVAESVLNRTVEMGLVEGPLTETLRKTLSQEGIKTRVIARNELFLIVPNNEKYTEIKTITLEELRQLPLIIREKGSGIRNTVESVLSEAGITLKDLSVILELNTTNSITSAVASGKGVSLLPKMALRKELNYKIVKALTVDGISFNHDFTLLYHNAENGRPPYNAFLKFLHSKDRGFC
jgi:LysR family transcriptional regulator, transcriptional activator of the cysJI operon